MLNVFLGYEQANKYAIKTEEGVDIGYIAEEESSIKGTVLRQLLRTRRAFKADVLALDGTKLLTITRPIKYFLNSEINVLKDNQVIGSAKSDWHLWRRRYDTFRKS